jgi:nicotinamide mononucleotide transporter
MALNIFLWINTAIAIIGTYLNARQVRYGFVLWMVTNFIFTGYNVLSGCWPQAFLFATYFGLAIYGWRSWKPAVK